MEKLARVPVNRPTTGNPTQPSIHWLFEVGLDRFLRRSVWQRILQSK